MINTGHKRVGRERAGHAETVGAAKIGGDVTAIDQMINARAGRSWFDSFVAHQIPKRLSQRRQGRRA